MTRSVFFRKAPHQELEGRQCVQAACAPAQDEGRYGTLVMRISYLISSDGVKTYLCESIRSIMM